MRTRTWSDMVDVLAEDFGFTDFQVKRSDSGSWHASACHESSRAQIEAFGWTPSDALNRLRNAPEVERIDYFQQIHGLTIDFVRVISESNLGSLGEEIIRRLRDLDSPEDAPEVYAEHGHWLAVTLVDQKAAGDDHFLATVLLSVGAELEEAAKFVRSGQALRNDEWVSLKITQGQVRSLAGEQ